MKQIIIATLLLATLASCSKEQSYSIEESTVAKFSSAAIETKVSADGTQWGTSESIGVTMAIIDGGDTTFDDGDKNKKYTSINTVESAEVVFEIDPDATPLLYPNLGSVCFYAYYPYQASITDGQTYTIDISDQRENIDLMVADPLVSSYSNRQEALVFSHKLSKITLTLKSSETMPDLTKMSSSFQGLSTTGSYDFVNDELSSLAGSTTAVNFTVVSSTTTECVVSAIIIPETLSTAASLIFTDGEEICSLTLDADTSFTAGNNYTYSASVGNAMPTFGSSVQIVGWGDGIEVDEFFSEEITGDQTDDTDDQDQD